MRLRRIDPHSGVLLLRRCVLPLALGVALPCGAADPVSPDTVADVIAEHALAQQGFAIALASNVLQSHVLYVDEAVGGGQDGAWDGACDPLDDLDVHSGGVKATASPPSAGQDFPRWSTSTSSTMGSARRVTWRPMSP